MNNSGIEIKIFDTTMRDGAQSLPEANQFPDGCKIAIAHELAKLGVGVIEAGFPATPRDKEEVMAVAETIGRLDYKVQSWAGDSFSIVERAPVIAGLSRTVASDLEATWEAVAPADSPRIHTFISTDKKHIKAKFPGKSPKQVLQMGVEAVKIAQELSADHNGASIEFSAEAATTTKMPYLERVVRSIVSEGVNVFNVPDTVGEQEPFWMRDFYREVIGWVISENPDTAISAHNHRDLDMSTANSFALVKAAAEYSNQHNVKVKLQIETTICATGERAGNADVFPVVANIFKHAPKMPVPVNVEFNPGRSVHAANAIMAYAGLEVDRQSPITGEDTKVHRSGIHSHGVIKGGYTIYSATTPTFWGHSQDAVHENGKYQGQAGRQAIVDKVS